MKYKLETIPIWDNLQKDNECLLCSLMKKAEEDSIAYYLGSSVMNPETRVKVNTVGFCSHHLDLLAKANKNPSLAVLERSYFSTTLDSLAKNFTKVENAKKNKALNQEINNLCTTVDNRLTGCLICDRMQDRLNRYCYTVATLYNTDPEFKKALLSSKGFCLTHLKDLLQISKESLKGKNQIDFAKDLITLERKNLERVNSDLIWMTEKYKAENINEPWKNSVDAQRKVIYKLIGEGPITKR